MKPSQRSSSPHKCRSVSRGWRHHRLIIWRSHACQKATEREVRAALAERRIQTSVHYPPIHHFSYYEELGSRRPLPRTEAVAARVVTLPLYAHMEDDQVELVIEGVLEALDVPLS